MAVRYTFPSKTYSFIRICEVTNLTYTKVNSGSMNKTLIHINIYLDIYLYVLKYSTYVFYIKSILRQKIFITIINRN